MRATRPMSWRSLLAFALVGLATASRADVNVTVAASANLYRAGGNAPTQPGTNPHRVDLAPAPGDVVRFLDVAGTTDCDGVGPACVPTGPDGDFAGNATPGPIGAISVIAYRGATSLPLLGVFVGPDLSHPLLDGWDFRYAEGFASVAPGLGEPFWIGDGRTGTGGGAAQEFVVPSGATRLFLGFSSNTIASATGTIDVRVVVPEPGAGASVAVACATIAASARRRRLRRKPC